MRIVETCNFDSDYPNEKFVNLPWLTEEDAHDLCTKINELCYGPHALRIWKVVPDDYELKPGFEP